MLTRLFCFTAPLASVLACAGEPAVAAPSPTGDGVAEGGAPLPPQGADPYTAPLPFVVQGMPDGLASLSAQGCNACHATAHDTWRDSAHARPPSEKLRAAVRAAGSPTACVQCHLPLAAQHAELAAGYIDGDLTRPRLQPNAGFDATLLGEGVTCAACHVRDGAVLGVNATRAAPHPVVASPALADGATACATCHQLTWPGADQPIYDTWGEWKSSAWAQAGVRCVDCHMPREGSRGLAGAGGAHAHGGGTDLRRALTALVRMDAPFFRRGQPTEVGLTLQNTGAGHTFPTGNPWKVATIDVRIVDGKGKELVPRWGQTLARTVTNAPPWTTTADTRLPAGAQRSATHTFTLGPKVAMGPAWVEVVATRGSDTATLVRVPVEVR